MHLFPQRNADSYVGSPTDLALRVAPLHTRHRASDPDSPPLRPDLSSGFSGHSSYVKTGLFPFSLRHPMRKKWTDGYTSSTSMIRGKAPHWKDKCWFLLTPNFVIQNLNYIQLCRILTCLTRLFDFNVFVNKRTQWKSMKQILVQFINRKNTKDRCSNLP